MTTPADPNPADPKKRKSPGPLDARLLAQLDSDETIVLAAKAEIAASPAFATALSSHFLDRDNTIAINPASLTTLAADITAARQTGSEATAGTARRKNLSEQEDLQEQDLLSSIHDTQKRAKERHEQSDPAMLDAYWIGRNLKGRPAIEQAGAAIYDLVRTTDQAAHPITPQDTLPGFDQTKIDLLATRLGAYTGIQVDQARAQAAASAPRQSLDEQAQQISRRRRKLQQAIDSEYPAGPEHAAYRKQFGLLGDKSMS